MNDSSSEHHETLDHVKTVVGIHNPAIIHRSQVSKAILGKVDLVIVVGGDGTFLKTSLFASGRTLMLGVNSNPKRKEGFFLHCNLENFQKKFHSIMHGDYKAVKLARLSAKLDGKFLPPSLNEIFVGDARPYKMSYYDLEIGRKKEFQKTSGLLIAAPAGTHAWAHYAGGKKLNLKMHKYQVIAREPYIRKIVKQRMLKLTLLARQKTIITSHMEHGIVAIDGVSTEFLFAKGSRLEISLTGKSINIVV